MLARLLRCRWGRAAVLAASCVLASRLPAATAYFAQVSIGGGYSTVFSLLNTGSTTLTGTLTLTGQDGTPLRAGITDGQTLVTDSTFALTIPAGGTKLVTARSVNTTDATRAGWASVSTSGGTLAGVATFQLIASDGTLQAIAGVLPSAPVSAATIPVDDEVAANRYTGYAVANTGSSSITIDVAEVSESGSAATVLRPLTIAAGTQVAAFFFQDPKASQKFRGSAVFFGNANATFSIVALVQNQGLFTAIPVAAAAATPASLAGTWQFTGRSTAYGITVTGSGTIEQSGSTLSGEVTLSGTPCASTAMLSGTISGTTVTLRLQEGAQAVSFTGTVSGLSMSGDYTAPSGGCTQGDFGTWTARRTS